MISDCVIERGKSPCDVMWSMFIVIWRMCEYFFWRIIGLCNNRIRWQLGLRVDDRNWKEEIEKKESSKEEVKEISLKIIHKG